MSGSGEWISESMFGNSRTLCISRDGTVFSFQLRSKQLQCRWMMVDVRTKESWFCSEKAIRGSAHSHEMPVVQLKQCQCTHKWRFMMSVQFIQHLTSVVSTMKLVAGHDECWSSGQNVIKHTAWEHQSKTVLDIFGALKMKEMEGVRVFILNTSNCEFGGLGFLFRGSHFGPTCCHIITVNTVTKWDKNKQVQNFCSSEKWKFQLNEAKILCWALLSSGKMVQQHIHQPLQVFWPRFHCGVCFSLGKSPNCSVVPPCLKVSVTNCPHLVIAGKFMCPTNVKCSWDWSSFFFSIHFGPNFWMQQTPFEWDTNDLHNPHKAHCWLEGKTSIKVASSWIHRWWHGNELVILQRNQNICLTVSWHVLANFGAPCTTAATATTTTSQPHTNSYYGSSRRTQCCCGSRGKRRRRSRRMT